ncbi:MAG: hypothetical protein MJ101_03740, partial [Clostridia bacterium]|nr:hypothetical protein [Clostridia bacterium]
MRTFVRKRIISQNCHFVKCFFTIDKEIQALFSAMKSSSASRSSFDGRPLFEQLALQVPCHMKIDNFMNDELAVS